MRKTLLSLTVLAGLIGAGAATSVSAEPLLVRPAPDSVAVHTVQFYHGGPRDHWHNHWRVREWRHDRWERHHEWHHWRRF